MNEQLLRAILAMDAYNRGYNVGTKVSGSQIGDATVYKDALDKTLLQEGTAEAAGFYAVAYTLANGSKIISYRGTDGLVSFPWNDIGGDILNGYSLAAGSREAAQVPRTGVQ